MLSWQHRGGHLNLLLPAASTEQQAPSVVLTSHVAWMAKPSGDTATKKSATGREQSALERLALMHVKESVASSQRREKPVFWMVQEMTAAVAAPLVARKVPAIGAATGQRVKLRKDCQ
jgi:hypothetical protein